MLVQLAGAWPLSDWGGDGPHGCSGQWAGVTRGFLCIGRLLPVGEGQERKSGSPELAVPARVFPV